MYLRNGDMEPAGLCKNRRTYGCDRKGEGEEEAIGIVRNRQEKKGGRRGNRNLTASTEIDCRYEIECTSQS
jgi:hypothetical protein